MGATLREMRVRKGRGGGVGSKAYFSRPLYYQEGKLLGVKQRTAGRPAETINTKVSGKINLIFYKLKLFPIFLVDKVKKKEQKKTIKLSFVGS